MAQQLRDLVQKLSEAKNSISDSIARMQGDMPEENDLATMGDDDFGKEPEVDNDLATSEPEPDTDSDDADNGAASNETNAPTETPRYTNDEFSGNAAGRARKESAINRKPMLENSDRIVARQYARLINEGKSATRASREITNLYGIDIPTLISIVESVKEQTHKKIRQQDEFFCSKCKKRWDISDNEPTCETKK